MSHDHPASHPTHSHAPVNYGPAFAWGIGLNVTFVVVELIAGFAVNSLALLADAGHNASDVLGLLLAWGGYTLSKRRPSSRYTYGLRRSTIQSSLLSGLILLLAVGVIVWEAVKRLENPEPIQGGVVIGVALIGILINAGTALMFMRGGKRDLNLRGAYLHMAADAGVSLGVVLAGGLIVLTGWTPLDPIISLVIALVITLSTWSLLRDALNLSLDAVPREVDYAGIKRYLENLSGVTGVHDLHIWPLSTTETALTAHLVVPEGVSSDHFLQEIRHELHQRYSIEHATVQLERGDVPCELASQSVV